MYAFLVPVTVLLAVVFAASAVGKLRAPDRGAATFTALRMPVRSPRAAAVVVIAVEAILAVGLVTSGGAGFVVFSGVAVALTAAMLVAIARAHGLGASDDCGCFGAWMPSAIGPRLILRGILLLIAAAAVFLSAAGVFLLTGAPVGVGRAWATPTGAVTAWSGLVAAALVAAVVWSFARATGAPRLPSASVSGAGAGAGTGAVIVPDTGEVIDLLAAGTRARLVVFIKPGCPACEAALTALERAESRLSGVVDVYVVQRAAEGSPAPSPFHAVPSNARFALDVGGSLGAILGVGAGTPVGALVGTDGAQAGPLAIGSAEIAELIDSIAAVAEARA